MKVFTQIAYCAAILLAAVVIIALGAQAYVDHTRVTEVYAWAAALQNQVRAQQQAQVMEQKPSGGSFPEKTKEPQNDVAKKAEQKPAPKAEK